MGAGRGYAGAGWTGFVTDPIKIVRRTEGKNLSAGPCVSFTALCDGIDSREEARAPTGKTHVEVQVAVAVLVTVTPLQGLLEYDWVLRLPQLWQLQKGTTSQSVP